MSGEIKDIMDALENNELKNDGFWGRACSRLSQQLQKAKEENEKLMEQLNTKYLEWEETFMENQNLTQQNKQMREFIEKLYTVADDGQNMIKKHNDYNGKIYGLGYLQDIKDRIYITQQAPNKGVE